MSQGFFLIEKLNVKNEEINLKNFVNFYFKGDIERNSADVKKYKQLTGRDND